MKDHNFVIISVALDTGGVAAVCDFIRPATLELPSPILDIMGWADAEYRRAAVPTHPCLIDEKHVVAELYNMTNVPMGVWIAEDGRIVRPAEPAGASDGFRKMDRASFQMPADVADQGRVVRKTYVDAVRDWVNKGDASEYALSPEEVRARIQGPSEAEALAAANFRLGQYLRELGHADDAQHYFLEARRQAPESWHFLRQILELEEIGKASGPEFFGAVDALGERPYYPQNELGRSRKS